MKGYRNAPEQTAETIDSDGWLHTGDIGEFDEDGYLKIVDRKKELIINAGGKNMSPANIEAKVKASSPLIGQAVAIGDGRPYNVALITLDPDVAPGFAQQQGIADASFESLSAEQAVIDEVQRGVDAANESLARVEQIKKFTILPADWEPGGEELTPTMKLKRKPISQKYAAEIEALYSLVVLKQWNVCLESVGTSCRAGDPVAHRAWYRDCLGLVAEREVPERVAAGSRAGGARDGELVTDDVGSSRRAMIQPSPYCAARLKLASMEPPISTSGGDSTFGPTGPAKPFSSPDQTRVSSSS